jgi:hypothetical protein
MASAPPEINPLVITPAAPILPISGVDGYIALCLGISTPKAGEIFQEIAHAPGGSRTYSKQLYTVADRGKKIADSRVPPKIYIDGGTAISPTQYRWFPGGAFILFFQPIVATPGAITADFNYIPTSTATGEVYGLLHVNNWQLNLAANPIPGDEYGTMMAPNYRGKMAGTWQFERYSSASAVDLYMLMMERTFFVISLYESLIEQRQWICYGDIGASPMSAPTAGMVGGTVTGTLVSQPSLIVEPLAASFTP